MGCGDDASGASSRPCCCALAAAAPAATQEQMQQQLEAWVAQWGAARPFTLDSAAELSAALRCGEWRKGRWQRWEAKWACRAAASRAGRTRFAVGLRRRREHPPHTPDPPSLAPQLTIRNHLAAQTTQQTNNSAACAADAADNAMLLLRAAAALLPHGDSALEALQAAGAARAPRALAAVLGSAELAAWAER